MKKFEAERAFEGNPKWEAMVARHCRLSSRKNDPRSGFSRDYNRILHCTAYRRLKHKTQVFFATKNDHICTRIEHVNHVASVGYTIANELGLNTELTGAIAAGHDLGHAPFGHEGEKVLSEIAQRQIGERFWHEKNGLHFVDSLEILPRDDGLEGNLCLTYAVRDGIISHCGEVDDAALAPRDEAVDLAKIAKPGQIPPYSWEACVVKLADKISFLGRDLEDARRLEVFSLTRRGPGQLTSRERKQLLSAARAATGKDWDLASINTTSLMHELITDLCESSSPDTGLRLSGNYLQFLGVLREISGKHIYKNLRLSPFKKYARLIIKTIYSAMISCFDGRNTIKNLERSSSASLKETFSDWLIKYSDAYLEDKQKMNCINQEVYCLELSSDYKRACIDYISGMTDNYAIKVFDELIAF